MLLDFIISVCVCYLYYVDNVYSLFVFMYDIVIYIVDYFYLVSYLKFIVGFLVKSII